jgi:hypothetical protein
MKNLKYYIVVIFVPILFLSGCAKDFLNKPPTANITDVSFYKTDAEVMAATALLYSSVWFDYNDKASYALGDFRGGSVMALYNYKGNVRFNATPDDPENGAAYRAFYTVIGQSNLAILNINKYAGSGVSPDIKKYAIAEARYMRALAYRFLVMSWGDVPIITNNQTLLSDTTIQKNTIQSVWKFITYEMRAVANDLPEKPYATGRLTKWSAEGMLARFYLTRAGVESSGGVRNQSFLDSAAYYANRVITLSNAHLLSNYADLFKYPYNNNAESLFELHWVYDTRWGFSNTSPAYLAYSSDIGNGDGWGDEITATWWMMKKYEGFSSFGDPVVDTMLRGSSMDQRLKATFMLPGAYYPEITQTLNGVDQKLIFPYVVDLKDKVNKLNVKKYIVGQAKDVGGLASSQRYPNDTYMQRLAEIYLIYAEAIVGNNGSTSDQTAIDYFNKVHTRAGLTAINGSISLDTIFNERILEFAMEGMSWYDMVNLHYYNPDKTFAIYNSQDRGLFWTQPDNDVATKWTTPPTISQWTLRKTAWDTNRSINVYEGNFYLPLPAAEISQAPNLRKPAVDYYSGK